MQTIYFFVFIIVSCLSVALKKRNIMKKVQFVLKSFVVMGTLSQSAFASEFDDVAGGNLGLPLPGQQQRSRDLSFSELVALARGDSVPDKKEELVQKYSPRNKKKDPLPKISLRIYLPRNLMGPF